RRSQRFGEHVRDSMTSALVAVNMKGDVLSFNRAAEELLGFTEAEAMGQPFGALFGPDADALVRAALEHGRTVRREETVLRARDGAPTPVSFTTSLLREDRRSVYGVVATFVDLAPIKRAEEEARRLDRLAALGRFTSSVAHEVRNPLAGIGARGPAARSGPPRAAPHLDPGREGPGRGPGHRDRPGELEARLRAVLHDQAQGQWTRALHQPRHREAPRWRGHDPERGRTRHHDHGRAAAGTVGRKSMSKAQVLVVDDQDSIRHFVSKVFQSEGYTVRTTGSVRETREAIEALMPDLVVLDLKLPDGSGIELLRHIKRADPEVGVILMTAFGDLETAVESMSAAAFWFVKK